MTLLFILFILILSLIFFFLRYLKIGFFLVILTILFFFSIGSGFVPSILLTDLQAPFVTVKNDWGKQNAIVLLGAGAVKIPGSLETKPTMIAYSRIYGAAQLYRNCHEGLRACTIIISGGDPAHVGRSEAAIYEQALEKIGVPEKDIILEEQSLNTFANAQYTSAILQKKPFDKIILLTSGIHLRRALKYFAHFDIKAVPFLADYLMAIHSIIPLGYNFAMTDFALHEYIGMARFHVYNFLGWNK